MTLPFRSRIVSKWRAGYSLLEALVVLGILAAVLAIVLPSFKGPSSELRVQQRATEIQRITMQFQLNAVQSRQRQSISYEKTACDPLQLEVVFFPDGTASAGDQCITEDEVTLRLKMNRLIGRFVRVDP